MPNTINVALEVPITGSMVGTWGSNALNPNFAAIDGLFAGAQTIAVSNAPVTLTAPAGAVTPGAGPFQSLNRFLFFTGTLTANVRVRFPLPGQYVVINNTTGNFVLSFETPAVGQIVAVPQGGVFEVINNGTDCLFAKNRPPGELMFVAGITTLPTWMTSCSKVPYLICDGSIFNISSYPGLGSFLGSKFGGNGISTFGVPDLQGRYPLNYDGTGVRITVAGGAGFNGQTMGAVGGGQGSTLATSNMPPYTPAGSVSSSFVGGGTFPGSAVGPTAVGGDFQSFVGSGVTGVSVVGSVSSSFSGFGQGGTSAIFSNIPPTQVAGTWLVST